MSSEKTITEFLSDEYKEFSLYVIENRAIPSVIDGLKPVQRKIVHVSDTVWKNGSEKPLKVFQLSGKVASEAFYHHGDCLSPETEIIMEYGTTITILEWYEKYPDYQFNVISFNEETSQFVTGIGHSPRVGNITNIEYEIIMEDDSVFKCTGNHPFYTQRGWINAEDLLETDEIKSFYDTP